MGRKGVADGKAEGMGKGEWKVTGGRRDEAR